MKLLTTLLAAALLAGCAGGPFETTGGGIFDDTAYAPTNDLMSDVDPLYSQTYTDPLL